MPNLWTEIATAAVNLPKDYPGKGEILTALSTAQSGATTKAREQGIGMFTPEWYESAVHELGEQGGPALRFFINRAIKSLEKAQEQLSEVMRERESSK